VILQLMKPFFISVCSQHVETDTSQSWHKSEN